jgi:short-subunit dehydrogenase
MTATVLITGASNGIGLEFAKIHAEQGDNLVLVARSKGKLEALAEGLRSKFNVSVDVIAQDLSTQDAAKQLTDTTQARGLVIDILINNAGFGGHGEFAKRAIEDDKAMMQLNMVTLTELTHFYLQSMIKRNKGKILNVSSTASFIPGPLQAVYYATKAYVTSFSQAIAEELRGTNITVTALCPGAVATGFVEAGDLEGLDLWKNAKSPRSVAECGYNAMQQGKLIAINEPQLHFMLNWIIPFVPRKLMLKMSRQAMEKGDK